MTYDIYTYVFYDFFKVCVKKCPDFVKSFWGSYKVDQTPGNVEQLLQEMEPFCDPNLFSKDTPVDKLINQQICPAFILPSSPFLGRCVPFLKYNNDSSIYTGDVIFNSTEVSMTSILIKIFLSIWNEINRDPPQVKLRHCPKWSPPLADKFLTSRNPSWDFLVNIFSTVMKGLLKCSHVQLNEPINHQNLWIDTIEIPRPSHSSDIFYGIFSYTREYRRWK